MIMKFNKYLLEAAKINRQDIEMIKRVWPKVEKKCAPFLKELRRCKDDPLLLRGIGGKYSNKILHVKTVKGTRIPKDMDQDLSDYLDDLFLRKFHLAPRSNGIFTVSRNNIAGGYGDVHIIFPVGQYKYLWSTKIRDLFSDFQDDISSNWEVLVGREGDFDWLQDEYNDSYGEGSDNGHWEYKEWESEASSREEATSEIAQEIADMKSLDPNDEDYEETVQQIEEEVFNELEWYPDVDWENFIDDYIRNRRGEVEDKVEDIIKSYQTTDLCGALKSEHEITFFCKQYYCFYWTETVEKLIKDMVYA